MKASHGNDPGGFFYGDHVLLWTGGFFLAVIWIFTVFFISVSYENEIKTGRKHLIHLSGVVTASLDSSFTNCAEILHRISNDFSRNWNRYLFERYQAVNRLAAATGALPQLETIVVLDSIGTVMFTNLTSRPLSAESDRFHFLASSSPSGSGSPGFLHFDFLSRGGSDKESEGWITWPIFLPGEQLIGSVAALVSATYYNKILARSVADDPGIEMLLHTSSGHVFAGVENETSVSVDMSALPSPPLDTPGSFFSIFKKDGKQEKISIRTEIFTTGLQLTVSQPVSSALKRWKADLLRYGTVFVVLNLLVFMAFGQLWISMKRQRLDRQRLMLSERRFRGLFHNSLEGIAIYNAFDDGNDFEFIDLNSAAEEILSVSASDLVGQRLTTVFPGVWNMGLMDALQRVYRTGKHELLPAMHYEDGSRSQWIKNAVYSLSDTEVVAIFNDETEMHHVEAQKQVLESHLRQSQRMEAVGTLAGGIAHDFNNILSSVLGYTELALYEGPQAEGPMETYLKAIQTAGNRARDLVRQILTFARQVDEEVKPIRVALIVKEVLTLLRSSTPTTIDIHHTIDDSAMILGDSTQIYQVIMNLCTNATHAMDAQGGILNVEVSRHEKDDIALLKGLPLDAQRIVKVMVSDTGVGMEQDVVSAIFEPYFTTKKFGEGTGLGLAVVHGIVKKYGGYIHVESQMGVGSQFYLFFPEAMVVIPEEPLPIDTIPGGTERILMVDDEPAILAVSQELLEKRGYKVNTCLSSTQALDFFKSDPHAFDLVITDMTMPGMTGDMLARKIIEIRQDISIILCTGYSNKITRHRARELGIKAFLHKPVEVSQLAGTIRSVLDGDDFI
ncbi:hybrid sensor histidine kinase/response regulator [Desulfocicer niacini]